jgi:hypothetical protein
LRLPYRRIFHSRDPEVWSVVRVPSVAEEDARRLRRERDRLIAERVWFAMNVNHLRLSSGLIPVEREYFRWRTPLSLRTRRSCNDSQNSEYV